MIQIAKVLKPDYQLDTPYKGHGRQETQHFNTFDISGEYFDKRWASVKFQTLIQVKRTRFETKRKKYSEEVAYYMSNQKVTGQGSAEVL